MTDSPKRPTTPLHLHDDSEFAQTQSLLNMLGDQDAQAMPEGMNERLLEAIGKTITPAPIAIPPANHSQRADSRWSMRIAAAAVLATSATLVIVGSKPWATTQSPDMASMTLASLEQDLDAYFSLEEIDVGKLDEALTEWELWAQSVDTELDAEFAEYGWSDLETMDGEL